MLKELFKDISTIVKARKSKDMAITMLEEEYYKNYISLTGLKIRHDIQREETFYSNLKARIWSKWKKRLFKQR